MLEQLVLLNELDKYSYLEPVPDKWHLNSSETGKHIFISENEKILGVYFDNKLNFNITLGKLCKKTIQKLHKLARVSVFVSYRQIINAFYYIIVWLLSTPMDVP